jgi:hypothetical protein
MISTRVPLLSEPAPGSLPIEIRLGVKHVVAELGRGITVRPIRSAGCELRRAGYVRVGYDLYDIRGPHDWVLLETIAGWVPETAVTTDVQRHLFHLQVTATTPDGWTHDGDVPGCELHWVPLTQDPGLLRGQAQHLAQVLAQLRG